MYRKKVTLRLNVDVVEKAKNLGINLSGFLEIKLVEYMTKVNGTPRGRFELRGDESPRALQAQKKTVFL